MSEFAKAPDKNAPVAIDLGATISACGPQWAHESDDLDITLLRWARGHRVEAHVNSEVDVLMIVLEGEAQVVINAAEYSVNAGNALLIPKGCRRALEARSETLRYLSVHRRRRGLMPTNNLKP